MGRQDDLDLEPAPRGRLTLAVMALAGVVFVASVVLKPGQEVPSDPVAAAVAPMAEAAQTAPPETLAVDVAVAAAEGVGDAAEEATPIDWAMIGSALTFIFSGVGAVTGLIFGWRNDRRKERLADLRARELELEIRRLQTAA